MLVDVEEVYVVQRLPSGGALNLRFTGLKPHLKKSAFLRTDFGNILISSILRSYEWPKVADFCSILREGCIWQEYGLTWAVLHAQKTQGRPKWGSGGAF